MDIKMFNTAKDHLATAKNNFDIGEYLIAYEKATYCSECVLKSILIDENLNLDRKHFHHNQNKLLDEIIKNNLLSEDNIIKKLKNLLDSSNKKSMGRIYLSSDNNDILDCQTAEITNLRYPVDNSKPEEMVSKEDAENRIENAKKIVDIIEPLFLGF